MSDPSLFETAYQCILSAQMDDKLEATRCAVQDWSDRNLSLETQRAVEPIALPGLPKKLKLVEPRKLKARKLASKEGHAALIHSICHIEFNAINLAWDAVFRFRGMPEAYYDDWVRIAGEEAYHFSLLRAHLQQLGYDYGDFPAHNGLWEMALETSYDPLVRMALVPRVLEARGLDVTPGIMKKLENIGDERAVEILEIIQHDEIGHVEAGTRWFYFLCEQRGLEPIATFRGLLKKHMKGGVKGPLHREARRKAGFTDQELDFLEGAG